MCIDETTKYTALPIKNAQEDAIRVFNLHSPNRCPIQLRFPRDTILSNTFNQKNSLPHFVSLSPPVRLFSLTFA